MEVSPRMHFLVKFAMNCLEGRWQSLYFSDSRLALVGDL